MFRLTLATQMARAEFSADIAQRYQNDGDAAVGKAGAVVEYLAQSGFEFPQFTRT